MAQVIAGVREVFLPIEIVSREYAGHVVLAAQLASLGYSCVVGHKRPLEILLGQIPETGILFYKGGKPWGWLSGTHHIQIGLDPEAGISFRDFGRDFFATRTGHHTMDSTAIQFCYGRDDYEFYVNHFSGQGTEFALTGAPRVGLWGSEGDIFYERQVKAITRDGRKKVLFASSGGFTHEARRRLESTNAGATNENQSTQQLVNAARDLAKLREDIDVIIRPHPNDSWRILRELTADVPNLFVSAKFDLAAWVRAVSLVIHPGTSTAAIESVLAGTPAVSLVQTSNRYITADISHFAPDGKSIANLFESVESGALPVMPNQAAENILASKVFSPTEGASKRIAYRIMQKVKCLADPPKRRLSFFSAIQLELSRENLFGLFSSFGEYSWKQRQELPFKRQRLTAKNLRRDTSSAARILGLHEPPGIKKLAANCFLIHP